MNHGSLFSGIGGFDLAAEWMGWNNTFHCEWMTFPRKVLNHYWPNSISYEDITKTDFTIHRGTIDILTGGFPCQPYSSAGKRLGKEDERHLWPHMLRVISEVKPTYVVGENVRGLTNWNGGVVFEEVCVDLESQGYEIQPILLPACAVGAPHRRDRVWFIAKNTKRNGFVQRESEQEGTKVWEQRNACTGDSIGFCLSERNATNSDSIRQHQRECNNEEQSSQRGINALNDTSENVKYGTSFNSNSERLKGSIPTEIIGQFPNEKSINEINLLSNGRGREELSFERFPTQSPICGGDDGLPTKLDGITFPKWRQESIKGYGNAIVPQVAYEIFKVITEMDRLEKLQLKLF
jgi:DNA (cytosine-5)-methyltransferase 1